MKQVLLALSAGIMLPALALAQSGKQSILTREHVQRVRGGFEVARPQQHQPVNKNFAQLAKTTATPFAVEDFSSGAPGQLPSGWINGTSAGNATWKWTNVAATSQYNIGALNSSTAANGWMIYDSDSIGSLNNATSLNGWLESPSYDCSTHPTVQVTFQQYFRKFQDSCFLEVSNNNGGTWTVFSIKPNNSLANNSSLPTNPTTTSIDISSVAAGQADVKIRFRYKYNGAAGGAYNWLIDDVSLSELDPVEIGIDNAVILMADGTGGLTSFGAIPVQLVDTLLPVIGVSNNGSTASNANLSANVYNGTTSVYSQTKTLTALASGFSDSLVDFDPLIVNTTGVYTAAYSVTAPGDAVASNNIDSTDVQVTDTVYHRLGSFLRGSYYIHRPANSANGELSYSFGTYFTIPAGKSDTLRAISAAFANGTSNNSTALVRLFKFIPSGTSGTWSSQGSTVEVNLTTNAPSNISTTANIVYAYFPIDPAGPVILDEGDWAMMVVGKNIPANSTVLLMTADPSTPPAFNYLHGLADSSQNDGVTLDGLSNGGLPSRLDASPLIRLHFGKQVSVNVNDVNNIQLANKAYPNPANDQLTIDFRLKAADAQVSIVVRNVLGQVVKVQEVGNVAANQAKQVRINTSDLANGSYLYTIEADGQKVSERFMIAR